MLGQAAFGTVWGWAWQRRRVHRTRQPLGGHARQLCRQLAGPCHCTSPSFRQAAGMQGKPRPIRHATTPHPTHPHAPRGAVLLPPGHRGLVHRVDVVRGGLRPQHPQLRGQLVEHALPLGGARPRAEGAAAAGARAAHAAGGDHQVCGGGVCGGGGGAAGPGEGAAMAGGGLVGDTCQTQHLPAGRGAGPLPRSPLPSSAGRSVSASQATTAAVGAYTVGLSGGKKGVCSLMRTPSSAAAGAAMGGGQRARGCRAADDGSRRTPNPTKHN